MTEPVEDMTEYDRLEQDFRRVMGPTDAAADFIQQGLELEVFRETRHGKILIGTCMRRIQIAINDLVDPAIPPEEVERALQELRVQHRVLAMISETIAMGRESTKRVQLEDSHLENPDESDPL